MNYLFQRKLLYLFLFVLLTYSCSKEFVVDEYPTVDISVVHDFEDEFLSCIYTDDDVIWIGGKNGFVAQKQEGKDWVTYRIDPDVNVNCFARFNGFICAGTSKGIFQTDLNVTQPWNRTSWANVEDLFVESNQVAYAAGGNSDAAIYKTEDGGVYWEDVTYSNVSLVIRNTRKLNRILEIDSALYFFGDESGVIRTVDGGLNFEFVQNAQYSLSDFHDAEVANGEIYIVGEQGHFTKRNKAFTQYHSMIQEELDYAMRGIDVVQGKGVVVGVNSIITYQPGYEEFHNWVYTLDENAESIQDTLNDVQMLTPNQGLIVSSSGKVYQIKL